jgi:hypothetical protein
MPSASKLNVKRIVDAQKIVAIWERAPGRRTFYPTIGAAITAGDLDASICGFSGAFICNVPALRSSRLFSSSEAQTQISELLEMGN